MHVRLLPALFSVSLLTATIAAQGQTATPAVAPDPSTAAATASDPDSATAPTIPFFDGFNASLGLTTQHDAAAGYAWLLNPGIAYRFNSIFSMDAGAPIYMFLNVYLPVNNKINAPEGYKAERGIPGDTGINAHLEIHPNVFDYNFTASIGAPTGNSTYGVGAGQVTYSFNNHFEHTFGILSPDIELGFGDSSALTNTAVRKNYLAVGKAAFFQAGSSVVLPFHTSFEADAYESMPLARNTIYTTTGKGKKAKTTSTTTGAAEDNGFTTTLDIPINTHVTLTGFYNRSLRDHDDTAGFTVNVLLRKPHKDEDDDVNKLATLLK
jgi:hypothetical protein